MPRDAVTAVWTVPTSAHVWNVCCRDDSYRSASGFELSSGFATSNFGLTPGQGLGLRPDLLPRHWFAAFGQGLPRRLSICRPSRVLGVRCPPNWPRGAPPVSRVLIEAKGCMLGIWGLTT